MQQIPLSPPFTKGEAKIIILSQSQVNALKIIGNQFNKPIQFISDINTFHWLL